MIIGRDGTFSVVTTKAHPLIMVIGVKGRLGRHRRTFTFHAHCSECAVADALRLAKHYGNHGLGTYGPMVWKFGELSITDDDGAWVTVIREERPVLRVL